MKAEEDIRRWMELTVAELPPPGNLVPGAVRGGQQRLLRRRLTIAGVSLSVLALTAGLLTALPGGADEEGARVAQSGPAVAPAPGFDPSLKPTADPKGDQPWSGSADNDAAIFAALQAALPPGVAKVERDPGALGSYVVTRDDGTTVGLYAVFQEKHSTHTQAWVSCIAQPVPERPPFTDCRRQNLADGSPFVLARLERESVKTVQALVPLAWGPLVGLDSTNRTAGNAATTGDPLTYDQLTALMSDPRVLAALRG